VAYHSVGELIKGQETVSLASQLSVQEAAECMAEHRIGAIPVIDSGELKGLFTERDLLNRVVAKNLRPEDVRLEEVMTRQVISVQSDASLVHSLTIMLKHKFRHLPVLDGERVLGVLSCRDIPASYWIMWRTGAPPRARGRLRRLESHMT
jgi:CBS domain-containing protein